MGGGGAGRLKGGGSMRLSEDPVDRVTKKEVKAPNQGKGIGGLEPAGSAQEKLGGNLDEKISKSHRKS